MRVKATNKDATNANDTVYANWLKKIPCIPPAANNKGRKTQRVVRVEAVIAALTSLVPTEAAWFASSPHSRWRKMFSKTTMALSNNIPMPKAIPPNDIIFKVRPAKFIKMNVDITAIGIATEIISVLRMFARKMNSMNTAKRPPKIAVC